MKKILITITILSICISNAFGYYAIENGMLVFRENSILTVDVVKAWGNANYDFGYFAYDTDGNIVKTHLATENTYTNYEVGPFLAGDSIGFYYLDELGNTYLSTDGSHLIDVKGNTGNTNMPANVYLDSTNAGLHMSIGVAGYNGSGPQGGPIPGILLTLFCGGGMFGAAATFFKKFKKT